MNAPQDSSRSPAPPRWVVGTVKCCAAGVLGLPAVTTALLLVLAVVGIQQGRLGPWAVALSAALWLPLFALAELLVTRYPPVPRA